MSKFTIKSYNNNLIYIHSKYGYIYIALHDSYIKIINITIDKEFRNIGHGSELLKYMIDYIKDINILYNGNYKYITGDLFRVTEYIEHFYIKHGFTINDEYINLVL